MLDLITGGWLSPYLSIEIPAKTNKKLNEYKNKDAWQNTFMHLMFTALDRYYIDGLPDTCSQRVILQSLLWYGKVLFFKKSESVYALPCVNATDGYTVYGDWRKAFWVGLNGQSEKVNLAIPGNTPFLKAIVTGQAQVGEGEGVLVRENSIMYPFIRYCFQYADYMSDTLRTLDTARLHLKHPYVISVQGDNSLINTIKNWLKDTKDNQDVIVNTGVFPADKVKIQDLAVSGDIVNASTSLYEWYESQFLGLCGIAHNAQADKKGENLITPEIGIDTESDNTNLTKSMDYIQAGLDEANDLFGLNMQVRSTHISNGEGAQDATGYDSEDIQRDDNGGPGTDNDADNADA